MKFWIFKKNRIKTWEDFWKEYASLCVLLRKENKNQVADNLEYFQKFANGMTDGWFDFLNAFKKVIKDNRTSLSKEEKDVAENLLHNLEKWITNR